VSGNEMTNDELPEGWINCHLGDAIGYMRNGMVAKQTKDGAGLPISRIETIAAGTIDPNRIGFSNDVSAKNAETYRLKSDDILFSHINSPSHLGKTAIYEGYPETLYHGMNLLMLQAREGLATPRFLEASLRFLRVSGTFSLVAQHAVNQASINQKKLSELQIPLAPLAEQKRIADKLEAVLGRVDACRARLDRVPALLKRFRQSVLAAATSGKLTEEWRMTNGVNDGWEKVPLEDTIDGIEQGWSPKCENEPSTDPADWAVIKTTAIQEMAFLDYENKRLPKHLKPRPNLEIQPGDILITRAGPRVRAAVTCMVDSVRPRLIVCDKVYRFRARKGKTTPNYLNVFLNSPLIVQELDEMKTGISDSGVNLTQSKFRALQIPLPPLAEQQEIVRRVEALFAFADRIEARLATAQKTVERLTPATLAKAFRGELVPQDPNDEPARVLLEQLKTIESAPSSKAKRRQTTCP